MSRTNSRASPSQALLVVEVDGKGHDQPLMRLAAAHRDQALREAGLRVDRVRWADVHVRTQPPLGT